MAPPTASFINPQGPVEADSTPASLKQQIAASRGSYGVPSTIAKFQQHVDIKAGAEPIEDFGGNYRFAEIKESHTSRAMTSR